MKAENMTNEELNRAIHEALGKLVYRDIDDYYAEYSGPDYCGDLNVIAKIESELDEYCKTCYDAFLYFILNNKENRQIGEFEIITASARVRAEATLQVLKKGNK